MISNRPALIEALRAEEGILAERLVELSAVSRKLAAVRILIEFYEPSDEPRESLVETSTSDAVSTAPEPQTSAVSEQDEAPVVTTPAEPEEISPEPQKAAIPEVVDPDERIDPIDQQETRPEPQDSYAAEIGDIERRRHERDMQIRELWPTDMTVKAIGAKLGMHYADVSKRAKKLGLPSRLPRVSHDAAPPPAEGDEGDDTPAPMPIPVETSAATTALMEVPADGCHWPIGEPGAPGFHFCGKVRGGGRDPYCEGHQRMARGRP